MSFLLFLEDYQREAPGSAYQSSDRLFPGTSLLPGGAGSIDRGTLHL
jgi:hypothetical protein